VTPTTIVVNRWIPLLPGISDKPELLEQVVREARDARACGVWANLLFLRPRPPEHFLEAPAQEYPTSSRVCTTSATGARRPVEPEPAPEQLAMAL
jgi:hypothetical protein